MKRTFFAKRKEARMITIWCIMGFMLTGCSSDSQREVAEMPDSVYKVTGDKIVKATFDSLRNTLNRQMVSAGVQGSIAFCQDNAVSLTNTYADSTIIRRTSLRYRNPENAPDSLELLVLTQMSTEVRSGKVASARVVQDKQNGEIHYFKPIMTQSMCLSCHGKPGSQIQPNVHLKIKKLYPNDRAINFTKEICVAHGTSCSGTSSRNVAERAAK